MGLLQEINRQFLHPIGMALQIDGDKFSIQDLRHDPEGMIFDEVELPKYKAFAKFASERHEKREKSLGYIVQPLPVDPMCARIDITMVERLDKAIVTIFDEYYNRTVRRGTIDEVCNFLECSINGWPHDFEYVSGSWWNLTPESYQRVAPEPNKEIAHAQQREDQTSAE